MEEPELSCGRKIPEETGVRVHRKQLPLNKRKETFSFENNGKKSTSETELLCGENEGTQVVHKDAFNLPLIDLILLYVF